MNETNPDLLIRWISWRDILEILRGLVRLICHGRDLLDSSCRRRCLVLFLAYCLRSSCVMPGSLQDSEYSYGKTALPLEPIWRRESSAQPEGHSVGLQGRRATGCL